MGVREIDRFLEQWQMVARDLHRPFQMHHSFSVAIYAVPGSMAGVAVVCAGPSRATPSLWAAATYLRTVSRERSVPTAVCRWLFPACQRRKCGNGRRSGSQSGLMTLKIWQEVLENLLVYWPVVPEKRHAIQIQCYPPPHALSPPILTKIRIQVATSHPTSQAILTGYTPGYQGNREEQRTWWPTDQIRAKSF